jgi:hypothetical protein
MKRDTAHLTDEQRRRQLIVPKLVRTSTAATIGVTSATSASSLSVNKT